MEEFIKLVRRFSTYQLLEYVSKYSMEMFEKNEPYKFINFPYYIKGNPIRQILPNFIINQQEIINLSFISIKYGNDYRNNSLQDNSLFFLLSQLKNYNNELSTKDKQVAEQHRKFFTVLANEQFDYQRRFNSVERFNRLYHMFFVINKSNKFDQTKKVCYIDLEKQFYKVSGIEMKKYCDMLVFVLILIIGTKNFNIYELLNSKKADFPLFDFSYNELLKMLDSQAKLYSFYRKYNNWNILKYNPIVKSDKYPQKAIVTNIYSLLFYYSDIVYWIIRNYYMDQKKEDFIIYFGYCFECYFVELLNEYNIKYIKIEEKNEVTPDWLIETEKYYIIIEQKSSLFPLSSRSTDDDNKYKELDIYFKRNYIKAFRQLKNFSTDSKKATIRICLTFETIYIEEAIQEDILNSFDIPKTDQPYYWIFDISNFEKLIYILYNDENKFNEIIENKILLEKEKNSDGRGFEKLLCNELNDYITNKIDYFKKIELNIIEKYKSKMKEPVE